MLDERSQREEAAPEPEEFCPSCGKFVRVLVERTGWCDWCTCEYRHPGRVLTRCESCERPFPATFKKMKNGEPGNYMQKICGSCKTKGVTLRAVVKARVTLPPRTVTTAFEVSTITMSIGLQPSSQSSPSGGRTSSNTPVSDYPKSLAASAQPKSSTSGLRSSFSDK